MAEECAECGATFGGPADLVEHVRNAHPVGGPQGPELNPAAHVPGFTCIMCGSRFRSAEDLAAHNNRPHRQPSRRRFGVPTTA